MDRPPDPLTGPLTRDAGSLEAARAVLDDWGLAGPRPVLVCVGGAAGLGPEYQDAVRDLLRDHVLPVLARHGALVVDGGTDSGVMRLLGEAAGVASPVPLLGVAAAGTVRVPGRPLPRADAAELEPRHTGVLLVEGQEWGDEAPWIASVAGLVAGGAPSATLLVNGGQIAYQDAAFSVEAIRPVIAVAGTGRAADVIASVLSTGDDGSADPRAVALVRSGLITALGIDAPADLAAVLDHLLKP